MSAVPPALGSAPAAPVGHSAAVVAIGNFDGVHRGHQALLARARKDATSRGLPLVVLTFDPHPAAALGRTPPPRLTGAETRNALLHQLGVARVETVDFTPAFAERSPSQFAAEILAARLRAAVVYVGANFRFGHRREGTCETLAALGEELGFVLGDGTLEGDASAAPPLQAGRPDLAAPPHPAGRPEPEVISSSRIRAALSAGDTPLAARLLGRPHRVSGTVVHGDARGRTIQFPTANLGPAPEMLPAAGVYRTEMFDVSGTSLGPSVTNIGVRPTLGDALDVRVETHLIGQDIDLYDQRISICFFEQIRKEKKFSSFEELKAAIAADVATAKALAETAPS